MVLVQPVVAAGLGWWALGERVSLLQAVGATVTLAGVVLAQRSARVGYAEPEVLPSPATEPA